MAGFAVYRTGANVGLRCPCGWKRVFGRSVLFSEIQLSGLTHSQEEHNGQPPERPADRSAVTA